MTPDVRGIERGAPSRADLDDPRSARVLVLSSLFPTVERPQAGVFIRERMFRVGRSLPIVVLAPQAWFPFQGLIRLFRRHFRPIAQRFELQSGFEVHRPRFFCFPGVFKQADGLFMAVSVFFTARRLVRRHNLNVIDGHFGYPDGYAACLLGRWLRLPVMVTLRGKEEVQMRAPVRNGLVKAIRTAGGIVCVSKELAQLATAAGARDDRVAVSATEWTLRGFGHFLARLRGRCSICPLRAGKVLVSVALSVSARGFIASLTFSLP